jgi:chromate transporter
MVKETLLDWKAIGIAFGATILVFRTKLSPVWIILLGAFAGYLLVSFL